MRYGINTATVSFNTPHLGRNYNFSIHIVSEELVSSEKSTALSEALSNKLNKVDLSSILPLSDLSTFDILNWSLTMTEMFATIGQIPSRAEMQLHLMKFTNMPVRMVPASIIDGLAVLQEEEITPDFLTTLSISQINLYNKLGIKLQPELNSQPFIKAIMLLSLEVVANDKFTPYVTSVMVPTKSEQTAVKINELITRYNIRKYEDYAKCTEAIYKILRTEAPDLFVEQNNLEAIPTKDIEQFALNCSLPIVVDVIYVITTAGTQDFNLAYVPEDTVFN